MVAWQRVVRMHVSDMYRLCSSCVQCFVDVRPLQGSSVRWKASDKEMVLLSFVIFCSGRTTCLKLVPQRLLHWEQCLPRCPTTEVTPPPFSILPIFFSPSPPPLLCPPSLITFSPLPPPPPLPPPRFSPPQILPFSVFSVLVHKSGLACCLIYYSWTKKQKYIII